MDDRAQKGQILKQVREGKGLSLETVHEATKIPLDVLKAIEEGYTVRTLSPFYYRGFLKMYAQYLGVDVKKVIDDYQPEKLHQPLPEVPVESMALSSAGPFRLSLTAPQKVWLTGIVIFVFSVFLIVKVIGFFKGRTSQEVGPLVSKATLKKERSSQVAQFAKNKPIIKEVKRGQENKGGGSTATASHLPLIKESTQFSKEVRKKIHLTVRAKKDSWLQVKVDEEIVFQSTLKRGTVETWSADETIELAGRNINELEFELNGKMIGSLGREDRRAKHVVVTKNGLTVKK